MLEGDKIKVAQGENPCYLLLNQANRHGLIAGASGTGKTVTMKVLAEGFAQAGVPFFIESPTNQQFVCLTDAQAEALGREFTFEEEGRTADGLRIARFCTSWATTEEEVDTLIAAIRVL